MKEYVVLIDEEGNRLGLEEKIEAHKKGLLHKAFSIFIFNKEGKMLLQKRAKSKYHFSGLWSNACCSHPFDGELTEDAAHRRLVEELGFDAVLNKAFTFKYKIYDPSSGLYEHELDEVFIGTYDNEINAINKEEVEAVKWLTLQEIKKEIEEMPERFTFWFKHIFEKVEKTRAVNRES